MWIALLLVAAFVVWHFIPKRDPNQPSPRFRTERRAVDSDPNWPSYIEQHCESPAETGFLRAMISAYDLKPVEGVLSGTDLRLDFQVGEGPYRADFLVNGWLVVEIDGAAYHSSREAVARDKARDECFESLGYSVLRIPAKIVFTTPEEAVRRVKSAVIVGKRSLPARVQKSGWERLSDTFASISGGPSEINANMARSAAVQSAVGDAKIAFHSEKTAIESAIVSAKGELEMADWLDGQDQSTREIFERSQDRIAEAMAKRRRIRGDGGTRTIEVKLFPSAPGLNGIAEHSADIQKAYDQVAQSRTEFLQAQRLKLMSDARLSSMVEEMLREWKCPQYWALLRQP